MTETTPKDSGRAAAWGRVLGPTLAAGVVLVPEGVIGGLAPSAQVTAAISIWMAVWWMTEAIPLAATSLLPIVLFPLSGVLSLEEASAPYANKFVFLFMGGFMIARAIEKWHLHRRIALCTVLAVGTKPNRLVAGFMLATAALSMWISNTASTVMMLPIGMSLVTLLQEQLDAEDKERVSANFATCLMLGIAYAASIGGMATLVGTPTNLLLAGFLEEREIELSFAKWMLFALPLSAILLVLAWCVLTQFVYPIKLKSLKGGRALIRRELAEMGSVSRGEWVVGLVFLLTAVSWICRGLLTDWDWLVERVPPVGRLNDTLIALIAALTLFLIPIDPKAGSFALDWKTARTIPWGVLLLFGGGFCLAGGIKESGLADWIGGQVVIFADLPSIGLVLAVVTLVVFLTELTSNTPTAAAFLPILFSVAVGIGIDPMLFLVPATLAATCAFMLPVATPPNAIVFGSDCITIGQMIRSGLWMNLLSIILVTGWMLFFGRYVFGV